MTPPKGVCEFCQELVLHYQHAAYPVAGWEVERDQGGANQITGKVREDGRIAHKRCLESFLKRHEREQLRLA